MARNTAPNQAGSENRRAQKRERFVTLAEKRTVNAIKAIRVIGKLGNRSHYEYDEADVKKIAAALSREVETLKLQMLTKGGRETVIFKLGE